MFPDSIWRNLELPFLFLSLFGCVFEFGFSLLFVWIFLRVIAESIALIVYLRGIRAKEDILAFFSILLIPFDISVTITDSFWRNPLNVPLLFYRLVHSSVNALILFVNFEFIFLHCSIYSYFIFFYFIVIPFNYLSSD